MLFFYANLIAVLILLTGCTSSQKNFNLARRHYDLGNSLYATGKYPLALKELLKAHKLSPNDPEIMNSLGITYQARGRSDLAIKTLLRLLSEHPRYTEGRVNLARVYIESKNFIAAEKELSTVKLDLTYGSLEKVFLNEGLLYFDQKMYEKALEPFSKAIQFSRGNCSAQHFYGRSLFEIKKYAEATQALDRAISFCQASGNDEPHYFSALAHYRSGEKRKAAVRFDEIIKLYPNGQYAERSKSLLEMVRKELE
jgi:tetratricopeptide (TPR) repeat protein